MAAKRSFCCGGWVCQKCAEERNANVEKEGFDEMFSNKCPLCRERLSVDCKEDGAMVLEHSNKGKAWAQFQIGFWCLYTTERKKHGLSFDEKKSRELIEQAADQGDPDALFWMAREYRDEEMSNMHYLRKAADLGIHLAQYDLALFYDKNNEKEKYLHYITLAASQGHSKSYTALGSLFIHAKCGLTQSLILAKHYAGKSLEDAYAVFNFSFASFLLRQERYEGIVDIPGHSPIPTFLFWGRRALEGDLPVEFKDIAIECISELENDIKSHCANCRKEAGCSSFKRCVRCLAAWYCGKECQVQHWKAGHKMDCVGK
mmetsp:Transcript_9266/g.14244  ORF Transcript_9266/g.14244 Transcript_9266/m.14244 type:complete len:316 (+) Transcript_9266:402-1349(+)